MAANPWIDRRVLNWAHQGGAKEGPSSTMFAMRQAMAHGADAIELDVHMTADGQLVVCHDATVDRTTDGVGAIASMSLEQLRSLDNAYWWVPGSVVDHEAAGDAFTMRGRAPADAGLGIATLAEVLDAFPDAFLNFDIKQTAPVVPAYEQQLAEALLAAGRTDDVIVASFNDQATDAFKQHAPDITTSMGTMATAAFYQAVQQGVAPPQTLHVALQVPHRYGETTLVDARFVEVAHAEGLAVHVWTIDDEEEMAELVALGVDGIMTDRPAALATVLTALGAAYSRS